MGTEPANPLRPNGPQRRCCPLATRLSPASAQGRYSRAHCRPLRTTPQMKSPQRSHHVCVVGPAGWKRWPRPGTSCLAALRAVPGAMRSALARSSRVRPGAAHRAGARSRSSMSSGSADMALSGQESRRLWAQASAGRAGQRGGPRCGAAPGIQAERRESGGERRNGNLGARAVSARRRSGAAGSARGCSRGVPALRFLSSLHLASNSPPPNNHDDLKGPRGNRRVSGS